jgi:hypothetical protein
MDIESILSSALGFLVGLWASTYLQDRDVRRRHLGLVRALLAEVRRIRSEAGAIANESIPVSVLGAKPLLPQVSPWVQTALVDLASTSPEAIRLFMDLERHLANLAVFVSLSERASAELARREALKSQAEEAYDRAPLDDLGDALVAQFQAKREVENAERGTSLASIAQSSSFRHVQQGLKYLEDVLAGLERSLSSGPWTHLPWRRRP